MLELRDFYEFAKQAIDMGDDKRIATVYEMNGKGCIGTSLVNTLDAKNQVYGGGLSGLFGLKRSQPAKNLNDATRNAFLKALARAVNINVENELNELAAIKKFFKERTGVFESNVFEAGDYGVGKPLTARRIKAICDKLNEWHVWGSQNRVNSDVDPLNEGMMYGENNNFKLDEAVFLDNSGTGNVKGTTKNIWGDGQQINTSDELLIDSQNPGNKMNEVVFDAATNVHRLAVRHLTETNQKSVSVFLAYVIDEMTKENDVKEKEKFADAVVTTLQQRDVTRETLIAVQADILGSFRNVGEVASAPNRSEFSRIEKKLFGDLNQGGDEKSGDRLPASDGPKVMWDQNKASVNNTNSQEASQNSKRTNPVAKPKPTIPRKMVDNSEMVGIRKTIGEYFEAIHDGQQEEYSWKSREGEFVKNLSVTQDMEFEDAQKFWKQILGIGDPKKKIPHSGVMEKIVSMLAQGFGYEDQVWNDLEKLREKLTDLSGTGAVMSGPEVLKPLSGAGFALETVVEGMLNEALAETNHQEELQKISEGAQPEEPDEEKCIETVGLCLDELIGKVGIDGIIKGVEESIGELFSPEIEYLNKLLCKDDPGVRNIAVYNALDGVTKCYVEQYAGSKHGAVDFPGIDIEEKKAVSLLQWFKATAFADLIVMRREQELIRKFYGTESEDLAFGSFNLDDERGEAYYNDIVAFAKSDKAFSYGERFGKIEDKLTSLQRDLAKLQGKPTKTDDDVNAILSLRRKILHNQKILGLMVKEYIHDKRVEALKAEGYKGRPTSGEGNDCLWHSLRAVLEAKGYYKPEALRGALIDQIKGDENIGVAYGDLADSLQAGKEVDVDVLTFLADLLKRPIQCKVLLARGKKDAVTFAVENKGYGYDAGRPKYDGEPIVIGFVESLSNNGGGHFFKLEETDSYRFRKP